MNLPSNGYSGVYTDSTPQLEEWTQLGKLLSQLVESVTCVVLRIGIARSNHLTIEWFFFLLVFGGFHE